MLSESRVLRPHGRLRLARRSRSSPARRKNVVDPLQLKPGDYVVHQTHGIGRFVELTQREVVQRRPQRRSKSQARVPRARVRAVQARLPGRQALRADRSARPADAATSAARRPRSQQDGRQRLVGGEGSRAQGRARHRGRAGQALLGAHGDARATPSARTPRGSASSKRRSRSPRRPTSCRPSTRSRPTWSGRSRWTGCISGDVGFGKTEIAVRAAFKAVQDGKQVAMLVPTTLLVQAAHRDVPGALRRLPRAPARAQPRSRPTRRPRETLARARRRHGRRRDRHAPPAHRRRHRSKTSASSSSTRSSASASSTRTRSRS